MQFHATYVCTSCYANYFYVLLHFFFVYVGFVLIALTLTKNVLKFSGKEGYYYILRMNTYYQYVI